jgi:site-specific DNA-methyltransferase (adenine-specific)
MTAECVQIGDATLYRGDCRDILPSLGVLADAVIADIPFGTTQNEWDQVIPEKDLWASIDLCRRPETAIALHAQSPFDKRLACSRLEMFRYEWIWEKTAATGHLNAKKMPLKAHENVLIFYERLPTYNPQKTTGHRPVNSYTKHQNDGPNYGKTKVGISGGGSTERYPRSVLTFQSDKQKSALHPTQKPVALAEYLVRTYSNPGDTVLDFTMGSGTTGVACRTSGRKFIGIEKCPAFFEVAVKRLQKGDSDE